MPSAFDRTDHDAAELRRLARCERAGLKLPRFRDTPALCVDWGGEDWRWEVVG
jgi:hypothetical protein